MWVVKINVILLLMAVAPLVICRSYIPAAGQLPDTSVNVRAGVYYVAPDGDDANPGMLHDPWQTIQKAATTLVAGDTVYIRAGTYFEQVIPQNSGSSS